MMMSFNMSQLENLARRRTPAAQSSLQVPCQAVQSPLRLVPAPPPAAGLLQLGAGIGCGTCVPSSRRWVQAEVVEPTSRRPWQDFKFEPDYDVPDSDRPAILYIYNDSCL